MVPSSLVAQIYEVFLKSEIFFQKRLILAADMYFCILILLIHTNEVNY